MESDAATGREKAKKESGAKDRAEKAKDRIHSQRSSLESGSRFSWCVFAQSSFFALVLSLLRGALMLCSLLPRRQHIQDRCRPTSRSVSCNLRFGFSGLFSEAMGFPIPADRSTSDAAASPPRHSITGMRCPPDDKKKHWLKLLLVESQEIQSKPALFLCWGKYR